MSSAATLIALAIPKARVMSIPDRAFLQVLRDVEKRSNNFKQTDEGSDYTRFEYEPTQQGVIIFHDKHWSNDPELRYLNKLETLVYTNEVLGLSLAQTIAVFESVRDPLTQLAAAATPNSSPECSTPTPPLLGAPSA